MDNIIEETLKEQLKNAIVAGNKEEIERLKKLLKISPAQEKYFDKGLTGFPSVDQVWAKYYDDDADENAKNIPLNKTVWDVVEEQLLKYYDIPAIEYFGKVVSREEFREKVYTWARTFRAMGVEVEERVPIYGPFFPDIAAMFFALIAIGATPHFLKLAITPEGLAKQTEGAKVAVVFDGMWANVASEFSKDKFKAVMVATVTDDMPSPKKEIVSFMSKMQELKNKSKIPDEKKYIWFDKAKQIGDYYTGEVKVPFKADRVAAITSSSGTTGGVLKSTMATNESILSQVYSTSYSKIPYEPGDRTLNHFPPTAATSLNSLFLVGLVRGATIVFDPRVSENDFYNQLTTLRPNMCINTGSLWETFFNRVAREMRAGKKFDFSYAKGWMLGGEGTDLKKIEKWDSIMKNAHATSRIYGGYGLSEVFSGICIDRAGQERDYTKPIAAVGTPQAGMKFGVFDDDGNELSYNERGEIRVKTNAMMKGYFNEPELTKNTVSDGWLKTGDLAEIDENGFVYVWGRFKDSIKLPDGNKFYLFDAAIELKKNIFINDALFLPMPTAENENTLVAHIVWDDNVSKEDKIYCMEMMNKQMEEFLPSSITFAGYSEHETMLPYSPTTLKKDKNKMSKQLNGYMQVIDGELYNMDLKIDENGKYVLSYNEIEKEHKKGR